MGDAPRRRRSKGGGETSGGSINIMEICNNSVPTPVGKCCRRPDLLPAEDFSMHAEMENLPANICSVSGWRSGRSDKRKDLLQYLHCGHGSHHLGAFRAGFVTDMSNIHKTPSHRPFSTSL